MWSTLLLQLSQLVGYSAILEMKTKYRFVALPETHIMWSYGEMCIDKANSNTWSKVLHIFKQLLGKGVGRQVGFLHVWDKVRLRFLWD